MQKRVIVITLGFLCGLAVRGSFASMVDWDRIRDEELQKAASEVAGTGQASAQQRIPGG